MQPARRAPLLGRSRGVASPETLLAWHPHGHKSEATASSTARSACLPHPSACSARYPEERGSTRVMCTSYPVPGTWPIGTAALYPRGKVEHPGFCSGLQYRSAVFLSAIALWRWGRGMGVVVEVGGVQKDIKGEGLGVFQLHPKNTLSSTLKTHARLTQPSTLSSSLYR